MDREVQPFSLREKVAEGRMRAAVLVRFAFTNAMK